MDLPSQVVAALKKRGLPVESLLFPDEGHGWCKIANRSNSTVAITLFFVKYLIGSPMVTVRWLR